MHHRVWKPVLTEAAINGEQREGSCSDGLISVRSLTNVLVYSLSLTPSFTHSLTHSHTHSLTRAYSLTHSLTYSPPPSLSPPSPFRN